MSTQIPNEIAAIIDAEEIRREKERQEMEQAAALKRQANVEQGRREYEDLYAAVLQQHPLPESIKPYLVPVDQVVSEDELEREGRNPSKDMLPYLRFEIPGLAPIIYNPGNFYWKVASARDSFDLDKPPGFGFHNSPWETDLNTALVLAKGSALELEEMVRQFEQARENRKESFEERQRHAQDEAVQEEDARRKAEQLNGNRSEAFVNEVAIPIYAEVLKCIKNRGLLEAIYKANNYLAEADLTDEDGKPLQDDARAARVRCMLMESIIDDLDGFWSLKKEGPVAVAKALAELSLDWGVKLPADWSERAKAYETVSVETEAGEEEDDE